MTDKVQFTEPSAQICSTCRKIYNSPDEVEFIKSIGMCVDCDHHIRDEDCVGNVCDCDVPGEPSPEHGECDKCGYEIMDRE